MLAIERSPLAAADVIVAALSSASFLMVGPIYGTEVGLSIDQIAIFLAIFVLGGALSQYPVGWLADRYDRRWVLIWLSVAAIFSCLLTAYIPLSPVIIMTNAAFGYNSVSNLFGCGSMLMTLQVPMSGSNFLRHLCFLCHRCDRRPITASELIEAFGPSALFLLIGAGHVTLVIYGLYRMGVRPTVRKNTLCLFAPHQFHDWSPAQTIP